MKPPSKQGSPSDYQTPPEALDPLMPYLPPGRIWEPAAGKGNLVRGLQERGRMCFGTDILTGQDFLMYEPSAPYELIVTNPPYDYKLEFLSRAYMLGKPFAFFMPPYTLETPDRQRLFRDFGLQLIMPDQRYHFETPENTTNSGSWFYTVWFTHGFNLPKDLIFTVKG